MKQFSEAQLFLLKEVLEERLKQLDEGRQRLRDAVLGEIVDDYRAQVAALLVHLQRD